MIEKALLCCKIFWYLPAWTIHCEKSSPATSCHKRQNAGISWISTGVWIMSQRTLENLCNVTCVTLHRLSLWEEVLWKNCRSLKNIYALSLKYTRKITCSNSVRQNLIRKGEIWDLRTRSFQKFFRKFHYVHFFLAQTRVCLLCRVLLVSEIRKLTNYVYSSFQNFFYDNGVVLFKTPLMKDAVDVLL